MSTDPSNSTPVPASPTPPDNQPANTNLVPPPIPVARQQEANPGLRDRPRGFARMDGPVTIFHTFETLLKNPGHIIRELHEEEGRGPVLIKHFLLILIPSLMFFGALLGTFSMGQQLWAAAVKVPLGTLFSAALCLPSLYILACLGGLPLRIRTAIGLVCGQMALASLLLLGFAPIMWIFTSSSHSLWFIGALTLAFWTIAIWTSLRLLRQTAVFLGMQNPGQLVLWSFIYLMVTFQVSTALRPILGKADTFLPTEKKFFLQHWFNITELER